MFRSSLHKNPIRFLLTTQKSTNPNLRFIHKEPITNPSSFTISYLINSCGLSPQSAISASQRITIKSPSKPDSILSLLKSYGLTATQLATTITKYPILLSFHPETNLKPKLDCFLSAGCSAHDLAMLISQNPQVLHRSLEHRIKPNFHLLRAILGSDWLVAVAVRRCPRLLENNLETKFLPNVRTLQAYGVPGPGIARLARVLMQRPERFETTVELVVKMGVDPSSDVFVRGVSALAGMDAVKWERKVGMYRSLGWSREEIMSAFTREPSVMELSDEISLRRRWVGGRLCCRRGRSFSSTCLRENCTRNSVTSVLTPKGLRLITNEEVFLNYYVSEYDDQVPRVIEAYKGGEGTEERREEKRRTNLILPPLFCSERFLQ